MRHREDTEEQPSGWIQDIARIPIRSITTPSTIANVLAMCPPSIACTASASRTFRTDLPSENGFVNNSVLIDCQPVVRHRVIAVARHEHTGVSGCDLRKRFDSSTPSKPGMITSLSSSESGRAALRPFQRGCRPRRFHHDVSGILEEVRRQRAHRVVILDQQDRFGAARSTIAGAGSDASPLDGN